MRTDRPKLLVGTAVNHRKTSVSADEREKRLLSGYVRYESGIQLGQRVELGLLAHGFCLEAQGDIGQSYRAPNKEACICHTT